MEKFKIAKSLCEIIPGNAYCSDKLQVQMPKSSQYAGYQVNFYFYDNYPAFFEVYQPRNNEWLFELIKSDREKGKKYKRFRLKWEELIIEFKEHQKNFDKTELPQGLAFIYDYDYHGNIEISRNGKFVIGTIENKWFYINAYERRRISAKNFQLIKVLEQTEIEIIKKHIKELEKNENTLHELTTFNGIRDKIKNLPSTIKDFPMLNIKIQDILIYIDSLIEEYKTNIQTLTNCLKNLK